jgi:RNA polymerase sporulation-specific sigma factor
LTPSELFEKNKKLVFMVVNRMKYTSRNDINVIDTEDMEQMGLIGLWKASEKFDPNKKMKFSTYAVPTIHGEITNALRDSYGHIKVPRPCKQMAKKLIKKRENGEATPTIDSVIEEFGCTYEDAQLTIDMLSLSIVSTELPATKSQSGRELYISEILADDNSNFEDKLILSEQVKEILSLVNEVEKNVLILTMNEKRQAEIAKELGISQAHVSRIYKRAIKKIQTHYEVSANENEPQFA